MGISPFLTKNILKLNSPFCAWGNFNQPENAEHPISTHPTGQCTQDISEVHTNII